MIPNRPPPRLQTEGRWSKEFVDFISKCLVKEPAHRPSAQQLLQVFNSFILLMSSILLSKIQSVKSKMVQLICQLLQI